MCYCVCEFIKDVLETVDISRDVGETCERFRTWFERRCTRNRGHFERCVNASERGLNIVIKEVLKTVGHFERCGRRVNA